MVALQSAPPPQNTLIYTHTARPSSTPEPPPFSSEHGTRHTTATHSPAARVHRKREGWDCTKRPCCSRWSGCCDCVVVVVGGGGGTTAQQGKVCTHKTSTTMVTHQGGNSKGEQTHPHTRVPYDKRPHEHCLERPAQATASSHARELQTHTHADTRAQTNTHTDRSLRKENGTATNLPRAARCDKAARKNSGGAVRRAQ